MRSPRSLVLIALVVAVVVAVIVLRGAGDEADDPAVSPSPTPSASPSPSLSGGTSPDAFCAAFRGFADAHGVHVAVSDDTSGAAVIAAADELIGLGRPIGLSLGGWLSLLELVNAAVVDIEGATPHPDPEDAAGATPDVSARDAYLASACPA